MFKKINQNGEVVRCNASERFAARKRTTTANNNASFNLQSFFPRLGLLPVLELKKIEKKIFTLQNANFIHILDTIFFEAPIFFLLSV